VRPRAIEVHIDELVLHGFSSVDGPTIGAAVERELARLFGTEGVPQTLAGGGARGVVDAGSIPCGQQQTPSATGAAVARAVYGGVTR
jgi:hypothetical protein